MASRCCRFASRYCRMAGVAVGEPMVPEGHKDDVRVLRDRRGEIRLRGLRRYYRRLLAAIVQLEWRLEEEPVNLHVDLIVDPHADDARVLRRLRKRAGAPSGRRG